MSVKSMIPQPDLQTIKDVIAESKATQQYNNTIRRLGNMTTRPADNYMKGVGRNEIIAEYNKDLRYISIRPMVSFISVERS